MNIPEQRDVSVDVAKGIGIILVVFGHVFLTYSVTSYIYAFHMPLFFFLSGYTFNVAKYRRHFGLFLKKNLLRLIVPFFAVAVISYILYVFYAPVVSLPKISSDMALLGILSGNGINLPFNDVLWFLPAFFCSGLIFLVLATALGGIRLFFGTMFVGILGMIIGSYVHLPFGLDIAMATQLFVFSGYLLRNANLSQRVNRPSKNIILVFTVLAALFFFVTFVFNFTNGRVDLMTRTYGEPILFISAGLSGSVAVLMLSLVLSHQKNLYNYFGKTLETEGRASMFVFMSHVPLFYCVAAVGALLWGFWIYYTFETYWYLLFVVGITAPTVVYLATARVRSSSAAGESRKIARSPLL